MSSRYSKMKDAWKAYRTKSTQKRADFINYLKTEKQAIIKRERRRLFRITFYSLSIGFISYLIYQKIYSKRIQISKMTSKLNNFYGNIITKEEVEIGEQVISFKPNNVDELTNLISMAYRYHYKIVVGSHFSKKQKARISNQCSSKCVFVDLSMMTKIQINQVSNILTAQCGAKCSDVNKALQEKGYANIFPQEYTQETLYDAVTNNLPLLNSDINNKIVNLQLISASGHNFRSAGEVNQYGQIPSLNSLFIGTGGAFALPTAANIKISKESRISKLDSTLFEININDINERVIALRKINQIDQNLVQTVIQSVQDKALYLTCKDRIFDLLKGETTRYCQQVLKQNGIPFQTIEIFINPKIDYNAFFNVNQQIFQYFLIKFQSNHRFPYIYSNGLLKIKMEDEQKLKEIINEITNHNGVFVWCKNKQLLLKFKPSIDSSEVGAELMRKIVEVRQGLDRRKVFYSHSRYEDYFAKGFFRRMTEFFW